MSTGYTRDIGSGGLVSSNSSGYAARIAVKRRHTLMKAQEATIASQSTEIETLKTQVAALQTAVTALQSGE